MMKIIYTRPDGGVSVVTPCASIEEAWAKLPPEAINPEIVEDSVIPLDRTFRNAWKAGYGAVLHDMEKCREIHRDRIREARQPVLESLDVAYMRAIECADVALQEQIISQKQALRDAPADPAIDAAKTPEELKNIWPI